ncbi:MAG: DNRLRE domain-containing protein [Candidatus Goldbacteria bacterium]|nr:DNRLRE domain-containing protein [Candidatus Goldiibacteriota bacterium]
MQKKLIVICAAIILSLAVFSCGPKGDSGAAGPTGLPGTGYLVISFQNGVYPDAAYAECEDARIWSDTEQNSNYGGDTYLQLGRTSGGELKRGLMKFDNLTIPTGAVVTDAYLTVYVNNILSGVRDFALYELNADWIENQATWNVYSTANSWASPGGDFNAAAISNTTTLDSVGYHTFRINASVVQNWLDNTENNYGFIIRKTDETTDGEMIFRSTEYSTLEQRPRLTVYYTAP